MAFYNVFGLQFGKEKQPSEIEKPLKSVVSDESSTGAVVNERLGGSGASGAFMIFGQSFEAAFQTNIDKINFYRVMAENPFVNNAIEDVVDDAVTYDIEKGTVSIRLEHTEFTGQVKQKIVAEFDEIVKLLQFETRGHEIFRKWYIDGQAYAHIIVNSDEPAAGIQEIRFADPRHIKKIIDVTKDKNNLELSREEYFLYIPENTNTFDKWNKQGRDFQTTTAVKLTNDSVIYIWSGLSDLNGMPLSELDKAIKSYNQLICMEDAIIVYRLSRAPEKLAFYIDVDNMPKTQAEQFMRTLIEKYKNKTVYDVRTGKVDNASNIQSMFHNYWLPRRNGKGTEISTVGGIGGEFAKPEEMDYFLKKLYRALQIPMTRLSSDTTTPFSHGSEITRDELKFAKMIDRFRARFSTLFYELLRRQLLLKNIITQEDWEDNQYGIKFDYAQDSMFQEMKTADLLAMRLNSLSSVKEYVGPGGFFSRQWVWNNVLNMSEHEIARMKTEIDVEEKRGEYKQGVLGTQDSSGGGMFGGGGDDDPGDVQKDFDKESDDSAKNQTAKTAPNLGSDDDDVDEADDDERGSILSRMSPSGLLSEMRQHERVAAVIAKRNAKLVREGK